MSLAEKIKVLIVDDQVTSRLLLGDALQQLGFKQITAAGDGEQGMKIMAQQPHHLVISDFNMPKMDGLGLLQAVRNNPATKKAAFIILTAQGDRALVTFPSCERRELGFVDGRHRDARVLGERAELAETPIVAA